MRNVWIFSIYRFDSTYVFILIRCYGNKRCFLKDISVQWSCSNGITVSSLNNMNTWNVSMH